MLYKKKHIMCAAVRDTNTDTLTLFKGVQKATSTIYNCIPEISFSCICMCTVDMKAVHTYPLDMDVFYYLPGSPVIRLHTTEASLTKYHRPKSGFSHMATAAIEFVHYINLLTPSQLFRNYSYAFYFSYINSPVGGGGDLPPTLPRCEG